MGQAELLISGLLVAVVGLSALARRLSVPYQIVLVVGSALLGFVPGLPEVEFDLEVVLLVWIVGESRHRQILQWEASYRHDPPLRPNLVDRLPSITRPPGDKAPKRLASSSCGPAAQQATMLHSSRVISGAGF
jgi:hypothetical protein